MIHSETNIEKYFLDSFGEEFLIKYKFFIDTGLNTYIRIDNNADAVLKRLAKYDIKLAEVKNVLNAYRVVSGQEHLGKTIEFTVGDYYIQSLSSMLPAYVLNPDENDITLDMCAAPGSKSTLLASLMNNKGALYTNEPSQSRIGALVYNLDRMAFVNFSTSKKKGELLSKNYNSYFTKILVDAPCSGLGILQKKSEINNWWNINQVKVLQSLQTKLLISAIKTAKIDSEIVYSTCTLTFEENELVLDTVLKNYPVELVDFNLPFETVSGITKVDGKILHPDITKSKRIMPWDINSEGFFIAKFVKVGSTNESKKEFGKFSNKYELLNFNNNKIKKYIKDISERFDIDDSLFKNFRYLLRSGHIFMVDKKWDDNNTDYERIGQKLASIDNRDYANLHTNAARYFNDNLNNNIVDITDPFQIKTYFDGGIVKESFDSEGDVAIAYEGRIIGTGVISKQGLKSRFPRALRTHEIIF